MRSTKTISIRRRAAVNAFKSRLLGALNIPGQPQTQTALDAMACLNREGQGSITERTWQSWLSKSQVAPQPGKLEILDRLASHLGREGPAYSESYYRDAACGGLAERLFAPTKVRTVGNLLFERAAAYEPQSALHLHLDAIDVAAMTTGFGDVVGSVVRRIAAARLLEILHSRWNPRSGRLYREWSKGASLRWLGGEPLSLEVDQRPNAFEVLLDRMLRFGFGPNSQTVGIAEDLPAEQIYKLLFALAADAQFLTVRGLEVWAMDAVSAALALFAYAWTTKYETFSIRPTPERCIYSALEAVFLREEPIASLEWDIGIGMEQIPAKWNAHCWRTFELGREAYGTMSARLGFSGGELREIVAETMSAEPHQYHAGRLD
ncbi:MAG: hypothetical protein KJZ96_14585 [Rhodocyclaceae bacterium]|nr:hypothetical protein [Rhodocyclaceae bacterium]